MALPILDTFPSIFFRKKKDKTEYLHKPPKILPKYGKKERKSMIPKTNVSRVLLYENCMHENVLDVQLRFLTQQARRVRFAHRKNMYAFVDLQNHRRKWHEQWEAGYQRMKDAYIAKYGTRYMPVPKEDTEIDPLFMYARLAPPINILCFYLESQQDEGKKKKQVKREKENQIQTHEHTIDEYLHHHERLISRYDNALMQYTNSTEDPRFRKLEETLVAPMVPNDGYLQLSPGYCKTGVRVKRWRAARHRGIVLPRFYAQNRPVSKTSEESRPESGQESLKDTTFPDVESEHSSISGLSDDDCRTDI